MFAGRAQDSESDSESDGGRSSDSDGPAPPGLQLDEEHEREPKSAAAGSSQTEQLYGEAGQFNPVAARAEKKKRKKQKKLSLGDDYNFAEAFADEVVLDDPAGELSE